MSPQVTGCVRPTLLRQLMNTHLSKSIATQLGHRIFAIYLALAASLTLLQIYFVYSNPVIVIERVKFSILLVLLTFAATTVGLWFIVKFFSDQLLTKPLRHFTEQIKSLGSVEYVAQAT